MPESQTPRGLGRRWLLLTSSQRLETNLFVGPKSVSSLIGRDFCEVPYHDSMVLAAHRVPTVFTKCTIGYLALADIGRNCKRSPILSDWKAQRSCRRSRHGPRNGMGGQPARDLQSPVLKRIWCGDLRPFRASWPQTWTTPRCRISILAQPIFCCEQPTIP